MPLDNSLENQGLDSGCNIAGTGQFSSGGKVTSTYLSTSNQISIYPTNFSEYTQLAMSFWVYVDSSLSIDWCDAIFIRDGGSNLRFQACNKSYHIIGFFNNTEYKMIASNFDTYGISNDYNKWIHICLTTEGNKIAYYVNGIKKSTTQLQTDWNKNISYIAFRNTHLIHLCNFMLWNNSLTPKQIQFLSRGLTFHMPLGNVDGQTIGRNLYRGTRDFSGENEYWTNAYSTYPTKNGYSKQGWVKETETYNEFTVLSKTATWNGLRQYIPTESGQQYTLSGYVKVNSTTNVYIYADSQLLVKQISPDMGWVRIYATYTATQEYSNIRIEHGDSSVTLSICGLKFEKGSSPTPWTPAPEDNDLIYDNIVYDVSGYNNNGTLVGTIERDNDSPRYKEAYNFNQTGYIKNDNFGVYFKEFTISYWIKVPGTISAQHFAWGTFNNWTGNGVGSWRDVNATDCGYSTILRSDAENNHGSFNRVSLLNYKNTWVFLSFVYTGTTLKTYVNGELYGNTVTYGSDGNVYMPVVYLGNSLFNNHPSTETDECSMVDFRIYATALSDTDIKELHNIPVSVTANGTLLTQGEITEE